MNLKMRANAEREIAALARTVFDILADYREKPEHYTRRFLRKVYKQEADNLERPGGR